MPNDIPVSPLSSDSAAHLQRAKLAQIAAQVSEYEELLPYLTYEERLELDYLLSSVVIPIWEPFDGPQSLALECQADELFYGGAAGGGKTDLLLGASLTQHWRSIIFRREYAELKGIRERAEDLFGEIGRFNGKDELWRITEGEYQGVRVEFGACQYEGDEKKFQGRPHDLKCFDEVPEFTEAQFRFLITWNRTARPGQRTRVIAAGNPPTTAEGMWVVKYWAPWLDPRHPRPAAQGELRYFITIPSNCVSLVWSDTGAQVEGFHRDLGGQDLEVAAEGGRTILAVEEGETADEIHPKSRTFIRARVEDNPRLMETGYRRTLQGLPEPLRSRMLRGDFNVGLDEDEWQVIPTEWILRAQARWAPTYEAFLEKQRLALAATLEEISAEPSEEPIEGGESSEVSSDPSATSHLPSGPSLGHPWFNPSAKVSEDASGIVLPQAKEPLLPESLLGLSGTGVTSSVRSKTVKGFPKFPSTPQELAKELTEAQKGGVVGVDVARGGKDETVYSPRLRNWFAPQIAVPGRMTTTGAEVIQIAIDNGVAHYRLQIDVHGVGASPVDVGRMLEPPLDVIALVSSERSNRRDRTGKLGFANSRSEWWWLMREALDPELGDDIALPPDPGLIADLSAPRWQLTARGIQVEPKDRLKIRIGRSPNKGDAAVYAHAQPYIVAEGFLEWARNEAETAQAESNRQQQRR